MLGSGLPAAIQDLSDLIERKDVSALASATSMDVRIAVLRAAKFEAPRLFRRQFSLGYAAISRFSRAA